jgi:hypothetical protein
MHPSVRKPGNAIACLLLLLVGLACQLTGTFAFADSPRCSPLELRLQNIRDDTAILMLQLETVYHLEQSGQFPDAGLSIAIPSLLGSDEEMKAWWKALQVFVPEPAISAAEAVNCENLTKELRLAWQEKNRYREALSSLITRWVALPRQLKVSLVRAFEDEAGMMALRASVKQAVEAGATDLLPLKAWIEEYRRLLGSLISAAVRQDNASIEAVWRDTLTLPRPTSVLGKPTTGEPVALPDNRSEEELVTDLRILRNDLRLFSTRLRNSTYLDDNNRTVFGGLLTQPAEWVADLQRELEMVPSVMLDRLTAELVRNYQHGIKRENLVAVLSGWGFEILLLALTLWGLLMLARWLRHWLAKWQETLYGQVRSKALLAAIRNIFWFLKPNADWLVLLAGSAQIRQLTPEDAVIFGLLSPIATMLTLYYFTKVLREWWVMRIFGRSNQFVTGAQNDDILRSSRHFGKLVVIFYLAYLVLLSAGGGRLYFLVIWVFFFTLWVSGVAYFRRHSAVINPFLIRLLPATCSNRAKTALNSFAMQIFYPPLLVLGQLYDLLLVLHQRLLNNDGYRRIATQILRLRLESVVSEESSESEGVVSEAYSSWFLQRSHEGVGILRQESLVADLLAPLQQWFGHKSPDNVLLISGHQGMGKTTVLDIIEKHWQSCPVLRLDVQDKITCREAVLDLLADALGMPQPVDIRQLIEFDTTQPRRIIMVDSCENLFLADVGRLDGMRAFLECVNAKFQNLYWVIVLHRPAWDYLSKVFRREHRILTQFLIPRWDAAEIRKLILSRHHRSGFRLQYDELLLAARATSDSATFRAAESRVFNLLWEQCNGNPEQALYLWLAAAQKLKGNLIQVGMPARPPLSALAGLGDDSCFVYAAIVIHNKAGIEELVACTNLPEAIVRHAIKVGLNLELLQYGEDRRYSIQPSWYYTVLTLLARKNMLHGQ